MKLKHTIILPLGLALTVAAPAAVIVGTSSISYTGTAGEEGSLSLNNENQIIDGSGLSAAPTVATIATVTHANVADGNAWATVDPAPGGGDFFADTSDTVSFEVVFDGTYSITDFAHWSYGFGTVNDNNISAITLDYGVGDFASSTGSLAIAEAASAGASVTTSLGGAIVADRVRITVTDNHFESGGDGGDRVGLTEIRFIGDAVPEPSSAALLGLGGLALILRRRK